MTFLIPGGLEYNPGIYRITNLITSKVYIGSAVSLKMRYNGHICYLRLNRHHSVRLQNSFNKRGESAFIFEAVRIFDKSIWSLSSEEIKRILLPEEQVWIDKYNASNPELGYNMLSTAGSTLGHRHRIVTREFIREHSKNSWMDPEIRDRRMTSLNNRKKWVLAYTYPEGNFIGKYKGVRAAAEYLSEETGIPYEKWSAIYGVCNKANNSTTNKHNYLSTNNFTFRWWDENSEHPLWIDLAETEAVKQKRKDDSRNAQKFSALKKRRWFLIYNRFTGEFVEEIFGLKDIGDRYGMSKTRLTGIIQNVKGCVRYVGDYIFKVKTDENYPLKIDPIISIYRSEESRDKVIRANQEKGTHILVHKDGEFFNEYFSTKHIHRELNIPYWKVNSRLKNGEDYEGYTFKYKDPNHKPRKNNKKKVATLPSNA